MGGSVLLEIEVFLNLLDKSFVHLLLPMEWHHKLALAQKDMQMAALACLETTSLLLQPFNSALVMTESKQKCCLCQQAGDPLRSSFGQTVKMGLESGRRCPFVGGVACEIAATL